MNNVGSRSEDFYRNCGRILRSALSVEYNLEVLISKYFCKPEKEVLFSDLMLINLEFGRKNLDFSRHMQE